MQTASGVGAGLFSQSEVQTTLRAALLHNSCPPIWAVAEGVGSAVMKNLNKYKEQRGKKK